MVDRSIPYQPDTTQYPLNLELSLKLSEKVGIPQNCYFNCRRLIMRFNDYCNAYYIEGWAINSIGLPMEHAWLVCDCQQAGTSREIIDPTIPHQNNIYFPGLQIEGKEGLKQFYCDFGAKSRQQALFYNFGWGGQESKSFLQSFNSAMLQCQIIHKTANLNTINSTSLTLLQDCKKW